MTLTKAELYNEADARAIQLRLDYSLLGNRIDLMVLCDRLGVTLVKYSDIGKAKLTRLSGQDVLPADAFTIRFSSGDGDRWLLFYNNYKDSDRQRFSVAHEIYHITQPEALDWAVEEELADHFARTLLVPPCLLIEQKYDDIYDVASDFGISCDAANNALSAAKNWRRSAYYSLTDQEKEFLHERMIMNGYGEE